MSDEQGIPELNPQQGGSYLRDPETGELHPVQPEQPTEE